MDITARQKQFLRTSGVLMALLAAPALLLMDTVFYCNYPALLGCVLSVPAGVLGVIWSRKSEKPGICLYFGVVIAVLFVLGALTADPTWLTDYLAGAALPVICLAHYFAGVFRAWKPRDPAAGGRRTLRFTGAAMLALVVPGMLYAKACCTFTVADAGGTYLTREGTLAMLCWAFSIVPGLAALLQRRTRGVKACRALGVLLAAFLAVTAAIHFSNEIFAKYDEVVAALQVLAALTAHYLIAAWKKYV